MIIGTIRGNIVSTINHPFYDGKKLLIDCGLLQQRAFVGESRGAGGVRCDSPVHRHGSYLGTPASRKRRCHINFMPPSTAGGHPWPRHSNGPHMPLAPHT